MRLPPAGFTNFHQATIETWVRWRSFASVARVFDFGARQREMYVSKSAGANISGSTGMKFLVVDDAGSRRREDVYGAFRLNEWSHVAVVTGPGGVRLYLNGVLVATNGFAGSLSSLGGENYFVGRENYANPPTEQLDGQLDEVRVWSVMRTEEEIRAWQPPGTDDEPPLDEDTTAAASTPPICPRCQKPMTLIGRWQSGQFPPGLPQCRPP
jgi:hypothetical protein